MKKRKICPVCGKQFEGITNKKCCGPECSKERNRQKHREKVEARKLAEEKEKEERQETDLVKIAKKARQQNMTYGQYVAMCYSRGKATE